MATFSLTERAVLIPVELFLLKGLLWWLLPLLLLMSGVSTDLFSLSETWHRGSVLLAATFSGIASGAVLVPLLLPYLPGRSFSLKGAISGMISGLLFLYFFQNFLSIFEGLAASFWIISVSSYLGMNFTGSTPFTSASGVEWEMKRAIPLQALLSSAALILWIAAPFV